ncbi:MAG: ATP-binding protein [Bacteroidia bacterium]|nr:ATP-binding protein [Bacteroidia bacterium]
MQIDLKELSARENERVEWKENGDDKDVVQKIVKTISAFANDIGNVGGGYVVCGAKEGKDDYGFPKLFYTGLTAAKIKEITGKVTQHCRDLISPSVSPIVTELDNPEDDSKRILVFTVIASPDAHIYRDGEKSSYYVRIGSETREARNGILTQLLIKKQKIEYFDKRINSNCTQSDIDILLFRDYMQDMGLLSPNKTLEDYFSETEQIAEFVPPLFGKVSLDNTLRPRNFTLLMFGKKIGISRTFPDAHVVLSVYKGTDRSETTAERHLLTGTLIEQAKKAIELLNTEAYVAFNKLSEKPNQVKYPIRALQEAVINAIVHRDYEIPDPIRITVFSDRIEVKSPGALHWAVDKQKFVTGKAGPKWRNQSFAYLFNKIQLAQSEGQGIPTILRTMKQEGCPAPIFELEAESVTCILPAHPRHQIIREIQEIQDRIILENYNEAGQKVLELLDKDPYNFRALDLFAEISIKLKNPTGLYQFLTEKKTDLNAINSNTLINIIDALTLEKKRKDIQLFANKVLETATSGRLEEDQIIRAAISLKKIATPDEVVKFINDSMRTYPKLNGNSTLLEKRATAKMDMAKKCISTGKDRKTSPRTKTRAWEMCRELLSDAEQDLYAALERVENPNEKFFIEQDISFLENLKAVSKKTAK